MDNKKLIYPSTSLLPMDDIAAYLTAIHNFANNNEPVNETKYVNGVSADKIAKAAVNDEGELIVIQDEEGNILFDGRESVKNAFNLNGKPASEYMLQEDGAFIQNFGENVCSLLTKEITNVKDELYQLKSELARNGLIKNYKLYSGFYDIFDESNPKYYLITTYKNGSPIQSATICGLSTSFVNSANINKIIPSKNGLIKVGDWFIISQPETGDNYLCKAESIDIKTFEEEITFSCFVSENGIPTLNNPETVIITKVQGSYQNGTYSFSKLNDIVYTGKEKYTMLNDDKKTEFQSLNSDQQGLGISFNLPSFIGGALKHFSVRGKYTGTPGALTCYFIDNSSISNDDFDITKYYAKSKIVTYDQYEPYDTQEFVFDFLDSETGTYPLLEGGKPYTALIISETANLVNSWDIQFSVTDSDTKDIQINNKAYNFDLNNGLVENKTIGDMIFSLTTLEIKEHSESPYTEGLYSSELISVPYGESIAKARLTMRINKEGLFKTNTTGTIEKKGLIHLIPEEISPEGLGIKKNDIMIINDQIVNITSDCVNNNITIDKTVVLDEYNNDIYRMGYQVFLRAMKKIWDEENKVFKIISDVSIPMTLKAVIPDNIKKKNTSSDRLIFECEMRNEENEPIDSNEFLLQIVWKSNLLKSDLIAYKQFIGRIYDLNLSFDSTL